MAKIKNRPHHAKSSHRHKPRGVSNKAFERVYWPYIPLLILAALLFGLANQSGGFKTVFRNPTSKVLAYATSISPQELLRATNDDREAAKQKPLTLNSQLAKAAQAKANDMASRDYWSHNTPAGNPPWVFVEATGYQYQKLGENLATGFIDSLSTINGWMASPEHRENMLDPEYTEVGFGFANKADYKAVGGGPMTIVVAFYGKPQTVLASDITSGNGNLLTGNTLPTNTISPSRAQVAFASLPLSNYAGVFAAAALGATVVIWISRHLLSLRRAFVRGENFVISHPVFDLGLILLGLALYALTLSAGFIQ